MRAVIAGTGAVLAAGALCGCDPLRARSVLVSVNAAGTSGANSGSGGPGGMAISPDGTKIAFTTAATDLGVTDTNESYDVYVRDLAAGTTTLVSANAAGTRTGHGSSDKPVFSPDGRRIAFDSTADDLGPTDTNGTRDIFVRDLAAGTTTMVSVNGTGNDSGDGQSFSPAFSPDGTRVVFTSSANDLGPTDSPRQNPYQDDVYIRDLTTRTTTLVSVDADGTDSGNNPSGSPAFSPDGTKVVFSSGAGNLGPTDTNGLGDLYLRDLSTRTTSLVTANVSGTDAGNQPTFYMDGTAVFSPDSKQVYFHTQATNLTTTPDANGAMDIFRRDLATRTTTLVTTNAAGTSSADGASGAPVLSPDGATMAFTSKADDLGSHDTNSHGYDGDDVYLRNLVTGRTTLVSVDAAGTNSGNGDSSGPLFSPDGKTIVFTSYASDLSASADTQSPLDVYARDLDAGITRLVSINAGGTDSADAYDGSVLLAVGPDGRIAFRTDANDLGPVDLNDWPDIYLATIS